MYRDLRKIYWWNGMKKDVTGFVAKCPNCRQVKVEHQRLWGLSQDARIPTLKWDYLKMDFIFSFHELHINIFKLDYSRQNDKLSHFILVKVSYTGEEYAKIYLREMVSLNGVPISNIFDRSTQFTPQFWKSFQKGLITNLSLVEHFTHKLMGKWKEKSKHLEGMLINWVIHFHENFWVLFNLDWIFL